MTTLNESVDVARGIDEVFAYVSDFTTTAEWDATATSAVKLTSGKIRVGTEFKVVCALPVGSVPITYRITELRAPDFLRLEGRSALFTVTDSIHFYRSERGTQIDYEAKFEFKGILAPVFSLSRKGLENMGWESVDGLRAALEDEFFITAAGGGIPGPARLLPELSRFTRWGYIRGLKRFNPMSKSMLGKHVVLTGATAGLGHAAAHDLATRGADLTLVVRDKRKGHRLVTDLKRETGNDEIRYELADLSLMADVDALIERFLQSGKPIDVLINNAGALFNPLGHTAEGLEQSYALLLLSPYRLTEGLSPLLLQTGEGRVINVVSGGMYTSKLDVDALPNDGNSSYSGSAAYAREKRALMVLTEEWAARWKEQGIVVNAMHPGWADTPGVRDALPGFRKITRPILRTAQEGADTIVWLAVAQESGSVTGKLFLDREVVSTHLVAGTQEDAAERAKLLRFLDEVSQSSEALSAL
ncbi:MAG: SDR family NAD(P)-dependent oxidoreductase [Halieaceae bacterium]|nr:SDR family NAD(P)-dependent oxidoreductase [Halieaceae bacterium]